MKYIITGYTGFIGKSLLERLTNQETLLIGRNWQTDPELHNKIQIFNPDYIIHCAAEIKDSSKTFESNILMTNWLLNVTQNIDYKAFISLGSSSEYGNTSYPMSEKELLKLIESTKSKPIKKKKAKGPKKPRSEKQLANDKKLGKDAKAKAAAKKAKK